MSKGGPKTMSSLTGSQQNISNLVAEFLAPGSSGKNSAQNQQMLQGSRLLQGATPFTGPLVAPLLPQYNQVKSLIQSSSPNRFDSGTSQALNYLLKGGGAQELNAKSTAKWFKEGVEKPAYREFDLNVAPRIRESFAAGGGLFSSRLGTEMSNAVGNLNSGLISQLSNASLQNQQLGAQLGQSSRIAGLQAAPGVANQGLNSAALIEALLGPFQEHEQQKVGAQYQEFLRTSPENSPYLNAAMSFINSPQLGVYNKPNVLGTAGSIAGGLLLGPALGGLGGGIAKAFGLG